MRSILMISAALVLSGCAAVAGTGGNAATAERETHYWLHPKLGMVKVDAKTHAMVVPSRAPQSASISR
ncbi:MAG: hypothetical protein HY854_23145 [Burkholderiales bacterium]|nr:hypothetical protein [Burkholderiales bacterium]